MAGGISPLPATDIYSPLRTGAFLMDGERRRPLEK